MTGLIVVELRSDFHGVMTYKRADDGSIVDRGDVYALIEPPFLLSSDRINVGRFYPNPSMKVPSEANAVLLGEESDRMTAAVYLALKEIPQERRSYSFSAS